MALTPGSSTPLLRLLRKLPALAASVAGLVLASASAGASNVGSLKVMPADHVPDAIIMHWDGPIARPMADEIRSAFQSNRERAKRVVFRINSGGGSVAEGERVIALLREIRGTHRLETLVDRGQRCGSMCVFIYLQGEHRVAALSSLWLFHEVSHHDPNTKQITRLDRPAWERLVSLYFGPAGVSAEWTERMKPMTVKSDFWQTGADLMNDKSGIFHAALGNQRERLIVERDPTREGQPPRVAERSPAPAPAPSPSGPDAPKRSAPQSSPPMAISWETKACLELSLERQTYVNVPCGRP